MSLVIRINGNGAVDISLCEEQEQRRNTDDDDDDDGDGGGGGGWLYRNMTSMH
jgi:hypothetical protein